MDARRRDTTTTTTTSRAHERRIARATAREHGDDAGDGASDAGAPRAGARGEETTVGARASASTSTRFARGSSARQRAMASDGTRASSMSARNARDLPPIERAREAEVVEQRVEDAEADASAGCGCFGSKVKMKSSKATKTRTIEDLDAEVEALETISYAKALAVADEEPVVIKRKGLAAVEASVGDQPTRSAPAMEDETRAAAVKEAIEIERARMEKQFYEMEMRLRSEEAAVLERDRMSREKDAALAERERLLAEKSEDVERRLIELQMEEKRLMSARTRSAALASTNASTTGAEGDLSDVGEAALESELKRMRKTTKQFSEKERVMLEQINALRRARDASESRVRQLADELKDVQKDHEMWSREEKAAERRFATTEESPSPAKTTATDSRDLPDWLRSPEPVRTATSPVVQDSASPTYKKFSPAKLIIPESTPAKTPPPTLGSTAQHPIFSAIRNGRVSEAQDILVTHISTFDVDTRDSFGNTVLIVAAQNNRKRVTKMCVKAGVPLDAQNKQGNTALHYCYGYGYFELGEYLINKGANPDAVNNAGETAFDGLSPEQRRLLRATRETLAQAKRTKHPHAAATRASAHPDSYSDIESTVGFTDDDTEEDDDAFMR